MDNTMVFKKLDDIQNTRFQLKSKRLDILNPTAEEIYLSKTKDLSSKDIQNMTALEILELNQVDENTVLLAMPDFDNIEDSIDYLKSMYVFLKQSDEMLKSLDDSMNELNQILDESNKAFADIMLNSEEKNVVRLIEKSLNKAIAKATTEEDKTKLLKSKAAFDDSISLKRIIELYKRIPSDNLKRDAQTNAMDVYNNYLKANSELGLTIDLGKISDFEKKHLPEEYHDLNNMFVFTCIKYISKLTKVRGAERSDDGFFASQLTTNIYLLEQGNLPDEYKERLLNAVKELLDLIR